MRLSSRVNVSWWRTGIKNSQFLFLFWNVSLLELWLLEVKWRSQLDHIYTEEFPRRYDGLDVWWQWGDWLQGSREEFGIFCAWLLCLILNGKLEMRKAMVGNAWSYKMSLMVFFLPRPLSQRFLLPNPIFLSIALAINQKLHRHKGRIAICKLGIPHFWPKFPCKNHISSFYPTPNHLLHHPFPLRLH